MRYWRMGRVELENEMKDLKCLFTSPEDLARVLEALSLKPSTTFELSVSAGLSVSSCYRKMQSLRNLGLVEECGEEPDHRGRPNTAYKLVDHGKVKISMGGLNVVLERNNCTLRGLDRV